MPATVETLRIRFGYGMALLVPLIRFFPSAWHLFATSILLLGYLQNLILDPGSRELKKLEVQSFAFMSANLVIIELYLYPLLLSMWNSGYIGSFGIVIVSVLPGIIYGHETPTINTHVPESRWVGAGLAGLLYKGDVGFPTIIQWLVYILLTIPSGISKLIFLEWIGNSIIWWWVDLGPAYSLGLHLFVNLGVKPWITHAKRDSGATIVLNNQRRALIWYVVASTNLVLLRPFEYITSLASLAFHSIMPSTTSGWAIVTTALLAVPGMVICLRRKSFKSIISATISTISIFISGEVHLLSCSGPFRYQTLKEGEIRLLRLHRRLPAWNGTSHSVECDMIHVSLADAPRYLAISYRWEEGKNSNIRINGFQFAVSAKVEAILRSKQSWFCTCLVWIDSICINQSDLGDKAAQVGKMDEIFHCAAWVVGWLGQPPRASKALKLLIKIHSSGFMQDLRVDTDIGKYVSKNDLPMWADFYEMMSNPWFERIWVIQEVAVSRNLYIRYGKWNVYWELFARVMAVLSQSGIRIALQFPSLPASEIHWMKSEVGVENSLVMENLRQWYKTGKLMSLEDTLKLCLRFNATDPRDKVFAIRGVVAHQDRHLINPNYKITPEAVFANVTRQILIRDGKPFTLLRHAGIGSHRNLKGLPSWVADWSASLQKCALVHRLPDKDYRASLGSVAKGSIQTSVSKLCLTGFQVDEVEILAGLPSYRVHNSLEDTSVRETLRTRMGTQALHCKRALALAKSHTKHPYPTGQTLDEAFWRTIVGDIDDNGRPASLANVEGYRDFLLEREKLMSVLDPSPQEMDKAIDYAIQSAFLNSDNAKFASLLANELSNSNPHYHKDFCSILDRPASYFLTAPQLIAGRSFCITRGGYMGLVPLLSRVGDVIVIFHGAPTPHVLRPIVGSSSFSLVGECYIHGMMDGEMMGRPRVAKAFDLL